MVARNKPTVPALPLVATAESPLDPDAAVQISRLIEANTSHDSRAARTMIVERFSGSAAPHLVKLLNDAGSAKVFFRIARVLADIGSDTAVDALALQARTQRRYVTHAVRALARCKHPDTVLLLLDLLQFGRMRQRRAAAKSLGSLKTPLAIEPLCQAVANKNEIEIEARNSLRLIGKGNDLARKVLLDPAFTVQDKLRILNAIKAARLSMWPFDIDRFLDAESRNRTSPARHQAKIAAEALRNQKTLLRPSKRRNDEVLLRPAGQSSIYNDGLLLRASECQDAYDDLREPSESSAKNPRRRIAEAFRSLRLVFGSPSQREGGEKRTI